MDPMLNLLMAIGPIVILFGVAFLGPGWLARRRLKRDRRWMEWPDVQKKARAGVGCLIVNHGNIPGKVWWVEELTDECLGYILSTTAFLTNCPF